jgi:hypothetical protein
MNHDEWLEAFTAAVEEEVAASEAWQAALKERGWPQGNPFPVSVFPDDPLVEIFERVQETEKAGAVLLKLRQGIKP